MTKQYLRCLSRQHMTVFPLKPYSKHPASSLLPTRSWSADASCDMEMLSRWFYTRPKENIGWALPDDILCIDVDRKTDDGMESILEFESKHGKLPATLCSETGGGGLHMFYRLDPKKLVEKAILNRSGFLPNVDLKTKGGYVVVYPSVHESGNQYKWILNGEYINRPDLNTVAKLPAKFYRLLPTKKESPIVDFSASEIIHEGKRDDTILRLIWIARRDGMDEDTALRHILNVNATRCKPPLSDTIVSDKVRRVYQMQMSFRGERLSRDLLEKFIIEKGDGFSLKFNVMKNVVEGHGSFKRWNNSKPADCLTTELYDALKDDGVKEVSRENIDHMIVSIASDNLYNPIMEYLYGLPTYDDTKDYIKLLYRIINRNTDSLEYKLFKKWIVQCVAVAHSKLNEPYPAVGVLVLTGKQGIGKTSFFKLLAPKGMFREGARIDTTKTDTIRESTDRWIVELGEINRTMKDIDGVKAFLTRDEDTYRIPYAKSSATYVRTTCFGATADIPEILIDSAGNRRFYCINANDMDLERLRRFLDLYRDSVWAQALSIFNNDNRAYFLTTQETYDLSVINRRYEVSLRYEAEVRELLDYSLPISEWGRFTVPEVANRLSLSGSLDSRDVGKVLAKLFRENNGKPTDIKRTMSHNIKKYLLPIKKPVY